MGRSWQVKPGAVCARAESRKLATPSRIHYWEAKPTGSWAVRTAVKAKTQRYSKEVQILNLVRDWNCSLTQHELQSGKVSETGLSGNGRQLVRLITGPTYPTPPGNHAHWGTETIQRWGHDTCCVLFGRGAWSTRRTIDNRAWFWNNWNIKLEWFPHLSCHQLLDWTENNWAEWLSISCFKNHILYKQTLLHVSN